MDIIIHIPNGNGAYNVLAVAEGSNPRGQSGIVLVVGDKSPDPGSIPLVPKSAVGLMDSSLESLVSLHLYHLHLLLAYLWFTCVSTIFCFLSLAYLYHLQ